MAPMTDDDVDLDGVRRLYGGDEAAQALLDHLAGRERDRRVTPVDRLLVNVAREGTVLSRGELIRVLRLLEELGCGRFVPGRRGHKSRFEWEASLVSVGQVAAGEAEEFEDAPEDTGINDEVDLIGHSFQLRRDLPVEIELPADLTASEADRLASFIKTIPFGE